MPEQQHRPVTSTAPVAPAVVPATETEPHLSGGGGNSLMLGQIGASEMDNGVRTLPGGGTEYGHDTSQDGWLLGGIQELDRLLAQAELASRFQIVDENFVGPRLPNQVTQEEFERIATLYSDIRLGNTNVRFGTDGMTEEQAQQFRNGVMGDIANILTTHQGRELMDQLAYQQVDGRNHTTTIGWVDNPAQAGAAIGPGGNLADAVNGHGTNAAVNYQPGRAVDLGTDLDPNYQTDDWARMSSDIVLFHELVHANHGRLGIIDGEIQADGSFHREAIEDHEAVGPHDHGVAREEYETVGLGTYGGDLTENGYRAERALVLGTAVPRRGNYAGSGPAPTP